MRKISRKEAIDLCDKILCEAEEQRAETREKEWKQGVMDAYDYYISNCDESFIDGEGI